MVWFRPRFRVSVVLERVRRTGLTLILRVQLGESTAETSREVLAVPPHSGMIGLRGRSASPARALCAGIRHGAGDAAFTFSSKPASA